MPENVIYPVILSGGAGTRLWPLSRRRLPKQFLRLTSDQTLFQETLARVNHPDRFGRPLIVGNADHRFIISEQVREMGLGDARVLLEPDGKNTAPAAALAACRLVEETPDALMLVMPSDHSIRDVAAFHEAVDRGLAAARAGYLVTFGIEPSRPETGYGYIRAGAPVDGLTRTLTVDRFVEKPDRPTAEAYLAAGGYSWNSGIFLFHAGQFLAVLGHHHPKIVEACRAAIADRQSDPDYDRTDADRFAASPKESIDYAVMEKTDRAAVVPVEMGWDDVGSWAALWDILDKDTDGNVGAGAVFMKACSNSFLRADGPAIAGVGLTDMVVVSTPDMVLVLPRERSQDVKDILAAHQDHGLADLL